MPPMIARVLSSMLATITGRITTLTLNGGSIGGQTRAVHLDYGDDRRGHRSGLGPFDVSPIE